MMPIIDHLKTQCAKLPEDLFLLSQSSCYKSAWVHPEYLPKPIFVKHLDVYMKKASPTDIGDVLLVDNSPIKNVKNSPFSAVHLPT